MRIPNEMQAFRRGLHPGFRNAAGRMSAPASGSVGTLRDPESLSDSLDLCKVYEIMAGVQPNQITHRLLAAFAMQTYSLIVGRGQARQQSEV